LLCLGADPDKAKYLLHHAIANSSPMYTKDVILMFLQMAADITLENSVNDLSVGLAFSQHKSRCFFTNIL
jgi:hypothetical protein